MEMHIKIEFHKYVQSIPITCELNDNNHLQEKMYEGKLASIGGY